MYLWFLNQSHEMQMEAQTVCAWISNTVTLGKSSNNHEPTRLQGSRWEDHDDRWTKFTQTFRPTVPRSLYPSCVSAMYISDPVMSMCHLSIRNHLISCKVIHSLSVFNVVILNLSSRSLSICHLSISPPVYPATGLIRHQFVERTRETIEIFRWWIPLSRKE